MITLAPKLAGICCHWEQGIRCIRSDNKDRTPADAGINEKLRYSWQPAWISLKKVLKEEEINLLHGVVI